MHFTHEVTLLANALTLMIARLNWQPPLRTRLAQGRRTFGRERWMRLQHGFKPSVVCKACPIKTGNCDQRNRGQRFQFCAAEAKRRRINSRSRSLRRIFAPSPLRLPGITGDRECCALRRFAPADVRRAPWDCPQGRGSSTIVSTTLIDACAIAGVGALSRKRSKSNV